MTRLVVYVGIALVSGLSLLFLRPQGTAFMLASSAAIGFLVPLVDACIRHFSLIRVAFMALRQWRKEVRVSISYLYQIKVDDRYLLIKSRRYDHFQPVGGVYKVYPAGKATLADMKAKDDDLYPIDSIGIDDLRIRVRGKHLVKVFAWFETRRGRETDVWREFQEELIESSILATGTFRFVRAEYVGTRDTGLRWSAYVKSMEVVWAEIYKLVPTAAQEEELRRLADDQNEFLYWANEDEILRRGARPNRGVVAPISEHSSWVL